MTRKSKGPKNEDKNVNWQKLHHRVEFSVKDEEAIRKWIVSRSRNLLEVLQSCLDGEWSIKVSPQDGGNSAYITVQPRSENHEFREHTFATKWANTMGAYWVASYMCLEMGERGDLFQDVARRLDDPLGDLI